MEERVIPGGEHDYEYVEYLGKGWHHYKCKYCGDVNTVFVSGFDDGTMNDGGDLIIDLGYLLGAVAPQTNGQGWMTITINGKTLSNGDYTTNSHSLTIKKKALQAGNLVITVKALPPNPPTVDFVLELIYDGGSLVGTYWK